MSISDLIVVMKEGVVHQISKPQAVYDDPVNLFVASFLGTPKINLFSGSVKEGKLFLGPDPVLDVPGTPDGEVTVGVRPEGFVPTPGGPMCCGFSRVEVMGRDTSIVFTHPALDGEGGRAIVDAENAAGLGPDEVRFTLRPSKTHLFDPVTGDRIRPRTASEA